MKVVVDRSRCSSIGLCEAVAPDVFAIGPDGVLHLLVEDIGEERRAEVEQACADCPTQALSIAD